MPETPSSHDRLLALWGEIRDLEAAEEIPEWNQLSSDTRLCTGVRTGSAGGGETAGRGAGQRKATQRRWGKPGR